jgi:outer membrane biosynthesis protein TonB
MQRSEAIALGVALVGHAVLFGVLSFGFRPPEPDRVKAAPIDVSLVDEVGLVAQAPQAVVPPAESRAPDQGPPEDAAPPAPKEEAQPDPAPPKPQPKAAPPPKPAPNAAPQPKKLVAPTPDTSKKPPTRDAAPAGKKPGRTAGTGSDPASDKKRARGSRLGDDFLKGLSDKPSTSKSVVPRAAVMSQQALADITSAIARQIQPCADRQVIPGPGANQIAIKLNLRLNRDGSLSAVPKMVGSPTGVDEDNGRYVQRVFDLGVAAFKGCSPLHLPDEYYQTPTGGWGNINFTWQLKH